MKNIRKIVSILLSIIIIMFFPKLSICQDNKKNFHIDKNSESGSAWNEYWKENREFPTQICITPGNNETVLNFSWYSKDKEASSKLKIYEDNKISKLIQVSSINLGNGFISNKAEIENLKANKKYYYSYTINGKWTEKILLERKDSDKFSFIFMGDPQIGSSYKSKNLSSHEEGIKIDAYNWNKAIEKALDKVDKCSFILCGGDETNTKNDYSNKNKEEISKMEYCGFLCPDYLRFTPIANTIGNHDKDNIDFYYHFNVPNSSKLGSTKAGSDYYFTYKNAIFLVLNTNNLNIEEHKKFIEETINKNSSMQWKIAVFHHDIYGCGIHSDDIEVKLLREKLPQVLEENNISLVFNGHDHIYSRSYKLYQEKIVEDMTNNSKGTIYITGGSSTGSKFYKSSKDNKEYIGENFEKEVPTYTTVDITKDMVSINTYRIDTNGPIDDIITIKNKNN
ncbi:MAG: metallophosphoesterase family protein [Terrisporobacter sp.]|uniref:metallophosphoesterase family protein n=1 Tax=Terrisporobacter sp. TaxID=1965305 RepID=UPI002FC9BA4F